MHCQTVTFSSVSPISSPSPPTPKFCVLELSRCSLQQHGFSLRGHLHKIHVLKQLSQHVRDYVSILSSYLMTHCLSPAPVLFSMVSPTNTFTSISMHIAVLPGFVIYVNSLRQKLPLFYLLITVQPLFLWLVSSLPRFLMYLSVLCCLFFHLPPSICR